MSIQEIEGQLVFIPSSFILQKGQDGEWEYGFQVEHDYDPRYPLIVDPMLLYSTYLGGSGDDIGFDIDVDSSGSAYVTGVTDSLNFPTQNPFQGSLAGGNDAFITKFSPAGNTLIYSTYLGGSGDDVGNGITVDSSGSAYVSGQTDSPNFPTQNPFQGSLAGGLDAFVTKLSSAGNALVYSTYLGGSGDDVGFDIDVDSSGSAYVLGLFTTSPDFPTQNPFQGSLAGENDAFATKFSPAGNTLVYSTYLGGSSRDFGTGIAVDSSGSAYVTGDTNSSNFPTQNPFQGSLAGGFDTFVTKFSPAGNTLVYSTYLGGSGDDFAEDNAIDSSGSVYVTGFTNSPNFPTQNPFQGSFAGGTDDAFVTKFSPTGSTLVYSTYLGGSGEDGGNGITVDSIGSAYVTGFTDSPNFPTVNAFQPVPGGGGDAFATKFNPSGNILVYSSYLGGSGEDNGFDIIVDSIGSAYVTGLTDSPNFPTTPGSFQPGPQGGVDGFVVKIGNVPPPTITCPSDITVSNEPGQCGAHVTYPPPTVMDECPAGFTVSCTPPSGSFFPVGTTTVTCTVTDHCGGSASCSFTITVITNPCLIDGKERLDCFLSDAEGNRLDPLTEGSILCEEIIQPGGRQDVTVTLPNRETVTLQKVVVLKKGFVVVQVRGLNIAMKTLPIPFQLVEKFFLCAPPGTTLNCRITDFECNSLLRCDSNQQFRQLDVSISLCQDVQMEALVKVEIETNICAPREEIPFHCKPPQVSSSCPLIFPQMSSPLGEPTDLWREASINHSIRGKQQETVCVHIPKVFDWVTRQVDVPIITLRNGEVVFKVCERLSE